MSEYERNEFLQHTIIIEEKVDGANLGISFDANGNIRTQNRGAYLHLPSTGQWKILFNWLYPRIDTLFDRLTDRLILFGEWCYAQHSVSYDRLPDWFLGFDVFDKSAAKFFSCTRRNEILQALDIFNVPVVKTGHFNIHELTSLLSQSQLSNIPAEGLYLRIDRGDWLEQRAKLVHPAFIQSVNQHWSRSDIKANRKMIESR